MREELEEGESTLAVPSRTVLTCSLSQLGKHSLNGGPLSMLGEIGCKLRKCSTSSGATSLKCSGGS
jgi:hypothetical protein